MNRVNRPATPDRAAPEGAPAPPPPWPVTGLPPYGDAAYGDASFGDPPYAAGASYGDPADPAYGAHPGRSATRTAADPSRWQTAAGQGRPGSADLRVVMPQPQAARAAGARSARSARAARTARETVPEQHSAPRADTAARAPGAGRAPSPGRALVAADCLAAAAGLCAVGPAGAPVLPVVLLCVLLAAHRRAGLYRPALAPAALEEVPAVALGTVLAWGLAAAAGAATERHSALGWPELLDAAALTGCTAVALRALAHRLHRARGRRSPAPTLVVGAAPAADHLAAALREHPEYGLAPVALATPADADGPGEHDLVRAAFATLAPEHAFPDGRAAHPARHPDPCTTLPATRPGAPEAAGTAAAPMAAPAAPLPRLAVTAAADIARVAVRDAVRHVVVVGPAGPATVAAAELLTARGCRIWQVEADERRSGSGVADRIGSAHLWGYSCRPFTARPHRLPRGKRLLDVVLAALALAAAAPVLAGCALAVRLSDGPGVLFRQERIGLGGRPFTLLKFRTLRPADDNESATLWNIAHDERTSAVGRLLRRTSLDELPQLWNVLRGDMSMVGPRPERPFYVEKFGAELPGYRDRHRMPAGITGLAQVNGLRGDTSIPDRARFDNHYIESWSLWQDVAIIVRTATSFFRFGGS
ncbi:sugar transferase [Actinacidiphila sp. bgisy144]|uniref:sugar transferase n=1 Tax=Actinacidiphila sp. bgisy144 TaxID=3413791 RepID=UPI003EBFAA13